MNVIAYIVFQISRSVRGYGWLLVGTGKIGEGVLLLLLWEDSKGGSSMMSGGTWTTSEEGEWGVVCGEGKYSHWEVMESGLLG